MSWKLPASISRLAVVFVAIGSTTLIATHWYSRAFDGNPIRLAKDNEGVVRLMTKLEALEERLESSKRLAAAAPNDMARAAVADAWLGAARAEEKRLKLAGLEIRAAHTAQDLEL